MTDSTLTTTADTTTTGTDPKATATTADPKKTDSSGTGQSVDITKLSDEEFEKVFSDPRLFKHSRFQQLNQRAKRADELEASAKEAEEKKLKDQQKWQELAEKKEQEAKGLREKYTQKAIDQAIQLEAIKAGTVDVEGNICI